MIGTRAASQFRIGYRVSKSSIIRFRAVSSMSVQQPPWATPKKEVDDPVLRVYNSLTKSKVLQDIYLSICFQEFG